MIGEKKDLLMFLFNNDEDTIIDWVSMILKQTGEYQREKRIASKYKFILVEIENKVYLVNLDENVPETTRVLRTKSGNSFRGV